MRRVDRRTNALPTDRQTDRPTNRPTDKASYRGALSHLKSCMANFFKIPFLYHDGVQVVVPFPKWHDRLCFANISLPNWWKYLWLISFDRSFEELSNRHRFFVHSSKNIWFMSCQSHHNGTGCCIFSYIAWILSFVCNFITNFWKCLSLVSFDRFFKNVCNSYSIFRKFTKKIESWAVKVIIAVQVVVSLH